MKMHKGMTNLEIAELLRAVAAAYEIENKDKNKFRIIAYDKAADAVEHASSELKDLWDENKLEEIPGIGESISNYLGEIFKTGNSKHFESILNDYPPQVFELMAIPGIGAKSAIKLTRNLNIGEKNPFSDLEKAAHNKEIEKLQDFGKESQEDILKELKSFKKRKKRYLLPYADEVAEELIAWLKESKLVKRVDKLGSLRRKVSTIGDIDLSAATENPNEVIEHFTKYPKIQRIIEKGDRKASVILPSGVQVDLRVQPVSSYGSLLQHFTGSKHHNIALREYALKKNLSLSEYGIKKKGSRKIIKFENEEDFYIYLDLQWIPPELREDTGEIDRARLSNKTLPKLIELKNVRADLQIHSDFDIETSHDLGLSSMEDIVDKANSLRYEYVAFTEHNPSKSKHSENEIINIIEKKKETIDHINTSYVKSVKGSLKHVYNSLEIDILPDGSLPLKDQALEILDFALVSIHSSFKMSKLDMTKRVLNALSHPKVKIFAHPTGRKLGSREGIELDWDKIFDFCIKNDKWLEINGDPMRLDLPDYLVKDAVEKGVYLTLGTDAHHADHMDNMFYGVSVARRGWAEKRNIINTKSFEDFNKLI